MAIVAAVILVIGALVLLLPRAKPGWTYLDGRSSSLTDWSRLYSAADLPIVTATLEMIQEAFFLRTEDLGRLKPADSLLAIYHAAYPSRSTPDSQEFEALALGLERQLGVPRHELQALSDPTVEEVLRLAVRYSGA